jgi:phospholipid/cholesterol/gamma-HCH transport system substrate-binding protein
MASKGREVKVGIFVLLGIVLTTIAVFLIGENEHFWQSKTAYYASFKDVAGLKPGSPVQLGGVDIGTVSGVSHSGDRADARIHVKMSIVKSEAVRLRQGTKAEIVNKGLLGDKMMSLTVPNPAAPEMPPGGEFEPVEPLDLSTYLAKLDQIAQTAQKTLNNLEIVSRSLADPKFSEDVKGTMSSLNTLISGIANNDSTVHRLLLDPREADKFDRLLADLDHATTEVNGAVADVRDVTAQIRTGPGLAHAMIYDGDVSKNAAGAIDELHKDLTAIREGNGLARAVIFGDGEGGADQQHMMKNLSAATDDVRVIVANIRAGKGTLGALLVDPSLYEDLRATVGNVQRSDVLRALVRYTIKKDEEQAVPPRAQGPAVKE